MLLIIMFIMIIQSLQSLTYCRKKTMAAERIFNLKKALPSQVILHLKSLEYAEYIEETLVSCENTEPPETVTDETAVLFLEHRLPFMKQIIMDECR